MRYRLIYDLADAPNRGDWVALLCATFTLLAIGCVVFRHRISLGPARSPFGPVPGHIFWAVWFGLAAMFAGGFFASLNSNDRALRAAVKNGNAETVEGPVEKYQCTGYENHKETRFTVAGATFVSSEHDLEAGYHDTPQNRLLHDGMQVRIAHVGKTITRLEIADPK